MAHSQLSHIQRLSIKNVTFAGSHVDNNKTQNYRTCRANLEKLFSKLKILLNSRNIQGLSYMITKISISEVWLIWARKKKMAGNVRFSNIMASITFYVALQSLPYTSLDPLPHLA